MKNLISILFLMVFVSANAFSQTNPVQLTGGKITITGSNEDINNATLISNNFSASSSLGGVYSPWNDICRGSPLECSFGKTFKVPQYPEIHLGGCIGNCYQFVKGTFVLNGITYENVYYRGTLSFDQQTFFIPRMAKRKGSVFFRQPFTLTGRLEVCQETNIDRSCPIDKILLDKNISGHGTLTVTTEIKIVEGVRPYPVPYLRQKSFEYTFEP